MEIAGAAAGRHCPEVVNGKVQGEQTEMEVHGEQVAREVKKRQEARAATVPGGRQK